MTERFTIAVIALLSTVSASACRCDLDSTGTRAIPAASVAPSTLVESSSSPTSLPPEAGVEGEPDATRAQDADGDASDAETGQAALENSDPLRLLACCHAIAQGSSRPPGDAPKLFKALKECRAEAQRGNREGVNAALRSLGLKPCRL